jgi:hypothetical protein
LTKLIAHTWPLQR